MPAVVRSELETKRGRVLVEAARRCFLKFGYGLSLSLATMLLAPARDARDDETPPSTVGPRPAWFLMGGPGFGGTIVTHDRGWFVGGEVSLVRMREGRFIGILGDGYYDLGAKRTYTSAAVEVGYKLIGIDGGVVARLGGDRVEWGPSGRLFVSTGIFTIYGRYEYFIDVLREGTDHVVQIGGLVKFPFAAWETK